MGYHLEDLDKLTAIELTREFSDKLMVTFTYAWLLRSTSSFEMLTWPLSVTHGRPYKRRQCS